MNGIRKIPRGVQTGVILEFPIIQVSSNRDDGGWLVIRKKKYGWDYRDRETANRAAIELGLMCGGEPVRTAGP